MFAVHREYSFNFKEQFDALKNLAPTVDVGKLSQLLSCAHALITQEAFAIGLPDFPLDNLSSAALILVIFVLLLMVIVLSSFMLKCLVFIQEKNPDLSVYDIFYRFYPYKLFLGKEGQNAVEDILGTFNALHNPEKDSKINTNISVTKNANDRLEVSIKRDNAKTTFHVSCRFYLLFKYVYMYYRLLLLNI